MKKVIIISIASLIAVVALIIGSVFFFVTSKERGIVNAVMDNTGLITQTGSGKCRLLKYSSDYYLECIGKESREDNKYYIIKDGTLKFYESGSGFFDTKEHCFRSDVIYYSDNTSDKQLEDALTDAVQKWRFKPNI